MEKYAENVLAASMMAQSLNCCLERKYLDSLNADNAIIEIDNSGVGQSIYQEIQWLKINQIGRPINNSISSCFSYIQKILASCALPNTQLTFLVIGDKYVNSIYLGLRNIGDSSQSIRKTVENLDSFVKVCWPGIQTTLVKEQDDVMRKHFETKYTNVTSLTGIPTLTDKKDSDVTTIEHLIGGLQGQRYAYLVTAKPIAKGHIDDLLGQCREMQGQVESLKSINVSESIQNGKSVSHSIAKSFTKTWSESEGIQQRDYKKAAGMAMLGAGITMSAALFAPAAVAILPAIGKAAEVASLTNSPIATFLGLSGVSGVNILSGFIPSKTHNTSRGGSSGTTRSEAVSLSESTTEGISRNLVNKHAEAASKQMEQYIKRFELAKAVGAWEVGCYMFSESSASSASWQLKSLLSGEESTLEPIRIHNISRFVPKGTAKSPTLLIKYKSTDLSIDYINNNGAIENQKLKGTNMYPYNDNYFHHPFGDEFSQLKTVLTTRELSALVNFPLHSVPGISVVDSAPEFSLTPQSLIDATKTMPLGNLLYGGTKSDIGVHLPLNTLSRHALVCGVNGSGKTNTVLSVLDGLMKSDKPFMVIEPAKTEYVDWAIEYNKHIDDPKKRIRIFIPGCERYVKGNFTPEKLKINPFEVIDLGGNEPRILSHIDRLKATFASAFPMQDILPVVMEHLLYDLYMPMLEKDKDDPCSLKNPTLSSVNQDFIKNLMRNLGYAQENTQNISAALRTRFNSLKYGWKGEMLNNERLTGMEWSDLFDAPCVINLSYAGDDQDRAFMMSLLLQFLYEYRIAETETEGYSFNDNVCRHLVVVEEAHRVMGRCDNPELPQYKSGMMFSNFLSEVRAYGQGMMVVDQVPTRLIEDAIKNTNIKIIHKLVASDDSQRIAECIGLTPEQQKVIAKLSIGQAVLAGLNSANVMSNDCADIYLAQINKMK